MPMSKHTHLSLLQCVVWCTKVFSLDTNNVTFWKKKNCHISHRKINEASVALDDLDIELIDCISCIRKLSHSPSDVSNLILIIKSYYHHFTLYNHIREHDTHLVNFTITNQFKLSYAKSMIKSILYFVSQIWEWKFCKWQYHRNVFWDIGTSCCIGDCAEWSATKKLKASPDNSRLDDIMGILLLDRCAICPIIGMAHYYMLGWEQYLRSPLITKCEFQLPHANY